MICFDPPPEWVCWSPGLAEADYARVSLPDGNPDAGVLVEVMRDLDDKALADGTVQLCGLWVPPDSGGLPVATLLIQTLGRTEPVDEAYQWYAEQIAEPPPMPGCFYSDYEPFESEVDLGPVLGQAVRFSDEESRLVTMVRYTVFPEVKDEVVMFEFQTLDLQYAPAVDDQSALILNSAFYLDPAAA